jgi:hypothetical protein
MPPRGSVIGVWGELVVIAASTDPCALIDAWHAQIDDRFDFALEGSRLEVKTTTRAVRLHRFGLEQLLIVRGVSQHVVSLMTAESDTGTSVADLVEELQSRSAGDSVRQLKLLNQVAATLGVDWPATARRRFDRMAALESLQVFAAADVPRVEPGPPSVSDVELSVDLSRVAPLTSEELSGLAALVLAT